MQRLCSSGCTYKFQKHSTVTTAKTKGLRGTYILEAAPSHPCVVLLACPAPVVEAEDVPYLANKMRKRLFRALAVVDRAECEGRFASIEVVSCLSRVILQAQTTSVTSNVFNPLDPCPKTKDPFFIHYKN